ncbi:ATP-binding protein [Marinimicrobium alkaliphilum]|uniref:ATP-binding protein n=1 Tax=Marinimicrobium alkaliphilum TaxID=2202654 RepID=UPI000DB9930C|nr:ATP-binding protein [Marinimicrobium alkaliphilum]
MISRLYLKIFFTFWLITALIIVTTNVVAHWFDLTPDSSISNQRQDGNYEPARRLLYQMVGSAINRNTEQVIQDLRAMPSWSTQYFYVIDADGRDLLGRPLPAGVDELLPRLTPSHPYDRIREPDRRIFGRQVTLNDGNVVNVVTVSGRRGESESDVIWQLFINNIWPLLLISILISGSLCLVLARYFSSGILTLQRATRQIADGDLSVRVSPHFARRRDEIAALGRDFDHMTARLEKAMLEQKRLIKDVSHELRSPLARLQVALGLAQQRSRNGGNVNKELDRIKLAADYLNDVISDILALPVSDNGGWKLDDTLDLRSLLETLVDNYLPEADKKRVRLDLHTDLDEALVPTHGNMLVGVFENILRNALHYTAPVSDILLDLTYNSKRQQYCVRICDAGPGVPEEELDDIFKPFYRTDQARDRESGGYGLGLAIAQRTVALHQGTIMASNRPEGGLCIQVCLPTPDGISALPGL